MTENVTVCKPASLKRKKGTEFVIRKDMEVQM